MKLSVFKDLTSKEIIGVNGGVISCRQILQLGVFCVTTFSASFYFASWLRTFRKDKNILCNPPLPAPQNFSSVEQKELAGSSKSSTSNKDDL